MALHPMVRCRDVPDALRFSSRTDAKKPIRQDGLFHFNQCLAVYGGRPARHPPGRCCATFKSAPGGFVLLRRALTDRLQIKKKARSFD